MAFAPAGSSPSLRPVAARCCRRCPAAVRVRRRRVSTRYCTANSTSIMPPGLCFTSKRPLATAPGRALVARIAHTSARSTARGRAAHSTWRRTWRRSARPARAQPAQSGPRDGLVFPGPGGVAAAAAAGSARSRDRDQQARVAVGPQRGVDVEQPPAAVRSGQPGDQLAHARSRTTSSALRLGVVVVVVQKHHVQVAAVAQLLAAELAVGDDGEAGPSRWRLMRSRPAPAQVTRSTWRRPAPRVVGHLLHGERAFDVARTSVRNTSAWWARRSRSSRALRRRSPVRTRPGGRFQFQRRTRRVETAVSRAGAGQLVDHAGVAHQVAHVGQRRAQQAQQALRAPGRSSSSAR